MFPLFIFGTLLITAFAVGTIISVVVQKKRQMDARLKRQQLEFDYQQALLRTRVEVQEGTLSAISQELHDHINGDLTAGVMQIRAASRLIQHEEATALLEEAKALVRGSIAHIRTLSHSLNSGLLTDGSLAEAIRRELLRISAFSDIAAALNNDADTEPGPEARLLIFRIVQEALQNVLKHADASCITIDTVSTAGSYMLTIADNGCGFLPADTPTLGLRSMRERTALLAGSLDIQSAVGQGTAITLRIPVQTHS